jgi:hypothetical protein
MGASTCNGGFFGGSGWGMNALTSSPATVVLSYFPVVLFMVSPLRKLFFPSFNGK